MKSVTPSASYISDSDKSSSVYNCLLSVVIPAFNAESFVSDAIESVLCQTYANFELLLIDDGSEDSTFQILREYACKDPRVVVLSHENWGMGRSLNHAMSRARSNLIVRLDADDLMEPTRLERQLAFLHEHPTLALTCCLPTYINRSGEVIGRAQVRLTTEKEVADTRKRDVLIALHHPGVLMRKDVVQSLGGYRPEFWPADDVDLWTRIVDAGGQLLMQPEYLFRYRVHDTSVSVKQARTTTHLVRWIKQCALERRAGRPEPTKEAFEAQRKLAPLPSKLNEERRDLAEIYYREATHAYSAGRNGRTVAMVVLATLLGSPQIPRQLWQRALRPALARTPLIESQR